MKLKLHQTHQTIQDFDKIYTTLTTLLEKDEDSSIHVFCELFLTGYPLMDLCLEKNFIKKYHQLLDQINSWSIKNKSAKFKTALIGGLHYTFDDDQLPKEITNVIYQLNPGQELEVVYTKILLPNYDIFDEKKYFTPGEQAKIIEVEGYKLGLLVCEDMWSSTLHKEDPVKSLFDLCQSNNESLDLIVNLSASPWHLGKVEKRKSRAMEIAKLFSCDFAYTNQVCAEDEILFDGSSFIVNDEQVLTQAEFFNVQTLTHTVEKNSKKMLDKFQVDLENTWEQLYAPRLEKGEAHYELSPLSDEQCQQILQALGIGLQDYAKKCGVNHFDVALSGGMDSALVLTIAKLFLQPNQTLEAIYMPGLFSASMSYDLSKELCQNLELKMFNFPIKFVHSSIRNAFRETFQTPMEGLADENIQSRLRGALLYARSNQKGSLVINTSNKSELAVGYSTLYGDSVGALSLLGDLYKCEVFALARYINRKFGNLIPEGIITRPPSAELRENQEDSQTLPPYERLDAILEGLLTYRHTADELVKMGFAKEEVDKAYGLYQKTEYKRKQFCPILKVKAKSFGFGHRVPICKKIF